MAKRTYNRRGRQTAKTPVTSSKRRPQRIKGAQTARRTGSKDKMTVSGQRTIKGGPRGAQGPATPPVQGPSRRVSGLIGSRGPNKVAQPPAPKTPKTPGKFTPKKPGMRGGGNLRNMGVAALAGALATGSLRNPVSKAKEKELRKKEAAAGKKRPMPSMGKDYKKKEKELSRKAAASNFDQAFAKARRAGKKTFTWRGKRYTTKLK
jgi:hypothetical protein